MIVDDELPIRRLLERMLSREGYDVLSFAQGEKALEAILENPPDLVLTDQLLPGCSGIELASQIKSHNPRTRIVLITGQLPEDTRSLAGIIDAFIEKPILNPRTVIEVIRGI